MSNSLKDRVLQKVQLLNGRRKMPSTFSQTTTRPFCKYQMAWVSTGKLRKTIKYSPWVPCTSTSSEISKESPCTSSSSPQLVKRRKPQMMRELKRRSRSNSKNLIVIIHSNRKDIAAFDIDSKVKDGRLALMYRGNTNKPQIWFQDLSCSWFFIANTFTDYFRLMIMHLGLPHWQYAFT